MGERELKTRPADVAAFLVVVWGVLIPLGLGHSVFTWGMSASWAEAEGQSAAETGYLTPGTREPFRFEAPIVMLSNAKIRTESTYDSHGFPRSVPDQQELRLMLLAGQFERLDGILSGYQREAEADFRKEIWISPALWAFNTADYDLLPQLNAWVRGIPESAVAYAARAHHNNALGWESRGNRYAQQTRRDQIEGMLKRFQRAKADIDVALWLNPRIVAGHQLRIGLASTGGPTFGSTKRHYQIGVKAVPNSTRLRQRYLFTLLPRWGG